MNQEQTEETNYCKNILLNEAKKLNEIIEPIKDSINPEVKISLIYIKRFCEYMESLPLSNIEEIWKFMNDIKGMIERINFVKTDLHRIDQAKKRQANG